MKITGVTERNTFNQLIEKCSENRHCLELLRFFADHPNARFNRLAIIQAHDENDREYGVERALVELINKGIVKVSIENNTHFYSLTKDESRRSLALEIARLEWRHWQLILNKAAFRWNETVNLKTVSI
jgi:hypothetical protein